MLIALPNADGSFTATLFLAKHGTPSFDTLNSDASIDGFLSTEFPDVRPLMPNCVAEFKQHRTASSAPCTRTVGVPAAWPH
jgi:kynurenine 3-monooxygenase